MSSAVGAKTTHAPLKVCYRFILFHGHAPAGKPLAATKQDVRCRCHVPCKEMGSPKYSYEPAMKHNVRDNFWVPGLRLQQNPRWLSGANTSCVTSWSRGHCESDSCPVSPILPLAFLHASLRWGCTIIEKEKDRNLDTYSI